ncbi:peroxidase family protein [Thiocapsa rosea]|uniref:Heme peroxidase n=1 Tax=Thiocapsa rosea TaxID=69360 RepID=A0A495V2C5_9GAMM|nr:heme peroxidase family protein [Thiocapsa rosea]RKT42830.1 heme peroxidase [Thiocapsa rosea]
MHGFENRGWDVQRGRFVQTGRFGRMFPELRSLTEFKPGAAELGKVGGAMDGGNPPPTDTSQNNPRIKAGYTFLGQFIDHDLTLDTTSVLEQQIDVNATHNFRTPALELDSLYGLGPAAQPFLYDRNNPFRFLLAPDGQDLPRNSQEAALIGDPRNDENIIVSQLHLLFLKFHNKVFNDHTDPALGDQERFEAAQTLVRWHYQWIVLNEFLPRTIGTKTLARIVTEKPFTYSGEAFMPVEFSVAAYRFGHSQVRPGYLINTRGAALFPDNPAEPFGIGDLRGGRAVPPELVIDWSTFFGPSAQPSKLIDTKLSTVVLRLPDTVVPPDTPVSQRSLATRNLQRGLDAWLPAGQHVACYLGIPPLDEKTLWAGVDGGEGLAPLWFYILREGEARGQGHRLAGVGAEIVGRVFVAILLADRASFLASNPNWTPVLPSAVPGRFTMTDLVNLTLETAIPSEATGGLPGDD